MKDFTTRKITTGMLFVIMVLSIFFSTGVFAANIEISDDATVGTTLATDAIKTADEIGVEYSGHVENKGDMPKPIGSKIAGPEALGTRGLGLRVEGFKISLTGNVPEGANIVYQVHVQNEGWMTAEKNGDFAGTTGKGERVESIKISLENLPGYDVYYRGHVQNVGDTPQVNSEWGWKKNGEELGTTGSSLRLEELQVKIVKRADVTYDTAGTFGPKTGVEVVNDNVTINKTGVILQNMHIQGNLTIGEGVGEGDVTLNNVIVDGNTYVQGGGKNSIHINGGQYNNIIVQQTSSGQTRIVAIGTDGLQVVISEDAKGEDIILEGAFDSVKIDAPDVKISTQGDTTIKDMSVAEGATGTQITLDSKTTVEKLVLDEKTDMNGQGTIKEADVNKDGVTFEKAPDKQVVDPVVVTPPVVTPPVVPPVVTPGNGGGTTVTKVATVSNIKFEIINNDAALMFSEPVTSTDIKDYSVEFSKDNGKNWENGFIVEVGKSQTVPMSIASQSITEKTVYNKVRVISEVKNGSSYQENEVIADINFTFNIAGGAFPITVVKAADNNFNIILPVDQQDGNLYTLQISNSKNEAYNNYTVPGASIAANKLIVSNSKDHPISDDSGFRVSKITQISKNAITITPLQSKAENLDSSLAPAVAEINEADTKDKMLTALAKNQAVVGINMIDGVYGSMDVSRRPSVANYVIDSKPSAGYTTSAQVKAAFEAGLAYEAAKWTFSTALYTDTLTQQNFTDIRAAYVASGAYRISIAKTDDTAPALAAIDKASSNFLTFKTALEARFNDKTAAAGELTNAYRINDVFLYINLHEINVASNAAEMQTALEADAQSLGLVLTDYNNLVIERKPAVALDMLNNKPSVGYTTVDGVKTMFNEIVASRLVVQNSLNIVNTGQPVNLDFVTMIISDLAKVKYSTQSGQQITTILTNLNTFVAEFNKLSEIKKTSVLFNLYIGGPYSSSTEMLTAFYTQLNAVKTDNTPPTVNTAVNDGTAKTITYTFSEAVHLVNQSTGAIVTNPAGLVGIYDATTYAAHQTGNPEPEKIANVTITSATLNDVKDELTISYNGTIPTGTYIADTWGYSITDFSGNRIEQTPASIITVTDNTPPTVNTAVNDGTAKTITYTFSEAVHLVNQSTGAIVTNPAGLVGIYDATTYAAHQTGNPEPEKIANVTITSATLNDAKDELTISYNGTIPTGTYIADTWGYSITDFSGNRIEQTPASIVTVTDNTPPTVNTAVNDGTAKTITYTFSEAVHLVNQSTGAIVTNPAGLVGIYDATTYAAHQTGNPEPEKIANVTITSATLNDAKDELKISYNGTIPTGTYIADTWGYSITDLSGNRIEQTEASAFAV